MGNGLTESLVTGRLAAENAFAYINSSSTVTRGET